jgi:hypothetical protein
MNKRQIIVLILFIVLLVYCQGNNDSLFKYNKLNNLPIKKIIDFYGLETGDYQLGIVTGNEVRFFSMYHGDDSWKEDTNVTFPLHSNSRDVFSFSSGIGIIIDNNIIFYNLIDSVWQEWPELMFNLPKNCQGVFNISYRFIGVIAENKVKFYMNLLDENAFKWEEYSEYEIELPENCQGVFADEWGGIFVIVDKKIKYISREISEEWTEINKIEFDLPDNFRGASYQKYLGITDDDKIKFYMSSHPDGGWVELINMVFYYKMIEGKHKS